MTAARIVIVAVLLPLAITGALILSAAATMNLFTSQGVTVAWAAVGMLEVTSLAGTLLWVLVSNPSLRRDAIVVTCGATGVALVAGVFAYGPVGAVAGVLLVALTHLASRAWREDWDAAEPSGQSLEFDPPQTVQDLVDTTTADPTPPAEDAAPVQEWSFDAAVAWAAREGAGARRIQTHTGLSEYKAKQAAAKAKKTHLRVAR